MKPVTLHITKNPDAMFLDADHVAAAPGASLAGLKVAQFVIDADCLLTELDRAWFRDAARPAALHTPLKPTVFPCVAQELEDEATPDAAAVAPDRVADRVADEAKRVVSGDREDTYGGAEDSFAKIARFWTAYLQNNGADVEVTAGMVSPMMRLLKEARIIAAPDHFDSHVDLVGYALTGARVNKVKTDG